MSPALLKKEWRQKLLERRKALGPRKREEYSRQIVQNLLEDPLYQGSKVVLLYVSFGTEVQTLALIKHALEQGKEVYLPRTLLQEKRLSLHRLFELDELEPGAYGILEPPSGNPELAPEALELVVTPGVGFDLRGGRLGYGGGFYDRLFQEAPKAHRLALAFSCQVVEELPLEPHDQRMERLITEKGPLLCKRKAPS